MSVVAFPPRPANPLRGWRSVEVEDLMRLYAEFRLRQYAARWEGGTTELGDPQFYVIGRPPDEDCLCAVTRLGGEELLYVGENGAGVVIEEQASLRRLVDRSIRKLKGGTTVLTLISRFAVGICAINAALEEDIAGALDVFHFVDALTQLGPLLLIQT
jgi:hypothetical protein